MCASTTPILDPAVLDRNARALEAVDPGLAARLREALGSGLAGYEPAGTRDGHVSLRTRLPDGSTCWLGRTSIPEVRAQALLDQFDPGTGNVVIPAFGQGREAALLLERLGPHRAVFVWETDALSLALPLAIHDFAESIRAQRLVLVLCGPEQLENVFVDWLASHPGHSPPARIMMWPWTTEQQLAPCQAALESAYRQTENRRDAELRQFHVGWPGAGQQGSPTCLAIMGLHARSLHWAWADTMHQAAQEIGWQSVVADIRQPGDVHPLARARKIKSALGSRLDWTLLLDVGRQDLQGSLPEATPAVCWLSDDERVEAIVAGLAGQDILAACTQRVADLARKAGFDAGRIVVCPLPVPCAAEIDGARPIDVAILADIGPLEAEPNGFRLQTEIEVWNRLRDMLAAGIETYRRDEAAGYLARAETQAGLRLESAESRAAVLDRVNRVLAPGLMWRGVSQKLAKHNVIAHVLGEGWRSVPDVLIADQPATYENLRQTCLLAKVVVHADIGGRVDLATVLAAGCGAVLAARAHGDDRAPGGLGTMLKKDQEYAVFRTFAEMVEQVRRLLADESYRVGMARAARVRCLAEHTPRGRLMQLDAAVTSLLPRRRD